MDFPFFIYKNSKNKKLYNGLLSNKCCKYLSHCLLSKNIHILKWKKKKKQKNIKELIYLFYVITFTIHIISHFILFYNSAH